MLQHFIDEYEITQVELARHLEWTHTKVNQIVKNKRAITPETALSFSDAFGNSPEFWLNLQRNWDLWHALRNHARKPQLKAVAS
jgi:addiction module HigA family antidote